MTVNVVLCAPHQNSGSCLERKAGALLQGEPLRRLAARV